MTELENAIAFTFGYLITKSKDVDVGMTVNNEAPTIQVHILLRSTKKK